MTTKEIANNTVRPKWMRVVGETMPRGNEGVKSDDLVIPRLSIIQDLSPQHKKSKAEYIEGAEPKMIFNTATNELYGNKVFVVPVYYVKEWIIWKDINKGGGFKGAYQTREEALSEIRQDPDSANLDIVDTGQHYCLVFHAKTPVATMDQFADRAVISMSKSQMKISRQFNTLIQSAGGDRWERIYELSVVDDNNAAGQGFYNWRVRQLGYVDEDIFKMAEKMYEQVKTGAARPNRESVSDTGDF
jgi:hypothetical protein